MKKWVYLLGTIFILVPLFFYAKYRLDGRHLKRVGYLLYFKRDNGFLYRQFRQKIHAPIPPWMQRQIEQDLSFEKITLQAIETTQQAITQRDVRSTNRYRIVGNKLYRYFDPVTAKIQENWSKDQKGTIIEFENGLKTLVELALLPNIDFIVTHEDGTREPFYLVDNPDLQAPVLGWAKLKSTPFLVLIPDWRSLSVWWIHDIKKLKDGKDYKGEPTPWDHKQSLAFWRGGLTESKYRLKIASLSQQFPLMIDAGVTKPSIPQYKPPASYEEHLQYKYLPVIDGIMCTYPGYQWRLLSDSVAFKQESDQIQWFYGALVPYVHYVPVKNDLSDLVDQIIWARSHDDLCKQIASNATEFSLKNLMFEDVYCYLYHLFVAYSHLQDKSLERDWKTTRSSSCWLAL